MPPSIRPRRRVIASPATLALAAGGSCLDELAIVMRVSRSAAGQYLSGRRRPPVGLPVVLRGLVGERAAARVLAAIPSPVAEPIAALVRSARMPRYQPDPRTVSPRPYLPEP